MGRSPCCDKSKVKRGTWSPEEDEVLKNYLQNHGTGGSWISLPHKAGLKRCGKSCRLRWMNYLRPDIKHGGFTQEEEYIICKLYNSIGSRWSVIASHLPGRTDNDVKNYWNTKLKKKFIESAASSDMVAAAAAAAASQIAPYRSDGCLNFGSSRLILEESSGGDEMNFPFYPPYFEEDLWLGRDEVKMLDELVRGIWGEDEEVVEAEVEPHPYKIINKS